MSGEGPLTLDIERSGNMAVVQCRGRLAVGGNDLLYAQVSKLIPETKQIVLDLTLSGPQLFRG